MLLMKEICWKTAQNKSSECLCTGKEGLACILVVRQYQKKLQEESSKQEVHLHQLKRARMPLQAWWWCQKKLSKREYGQTMTAMRTPSWQRKGPALCYIVYLSLGTVYFVFRHSLVFPAAAPAAGIWICLAQCWVQHGWDIFDSQPWLILLRFESWVGSMSPSIWILLYNFPCFYQNTICPDAYHAVLRKNQSK